MLTSELPQDKLTPSLAPLLTDVIHQVIIGDKASPKAIKAALLQKVGRGECAWFEQRLCWAVVTAPVVRYPGDKD